jgi:hypothetical protein
MLNKQLIEQIKYLQHIANPGLNYNSDGEYHREEREIARLAMNIINKLLSSYL